MAPVESPGLNHADVQEPGVHTPVPLADPGSDGIVFLSIVQKIYPAHVLVVAAVEVGLGHLHVLPLLPTVPGNLAHRLHSLKVAGHVDRLIVPPHNNGGISCVGGTELASLQFFGRLLLVGQWDVIEPDSPQGSSDTYTLLSQVVKKIQAGEQVVAVNLVQ